MPVSNTALVRFIIERWRRVVDAATWGVGRQGRTAIPNRSDNVKEAPQNRISDRHRNGSAGRAYLRVAREAGGSLFSAMLRMVAGSTWLCTSRISGSGRARLLTIRAVLIGGSVSPSKATSTTAPRTDTTVPIEATESMEHPMCLSALARELFGPLRTKVSVTERATVVTQQKIASHTAEDPFA